MIHADAWVMLALLVLNMVISEIRLEMMRKRQHAHTMELFKLWKAGSLGEYQAAEKAAPKSVNPIRKGIREGYQGWGLRDEHDDEPG